jgi:hypothetical protein
MRQMIFAVTCDGCGERIEFESVRTTAIEIEADGVDRTLAVRLEERGWTRQSTSAFRGADFCPSCSQRPIRRTHKRVISAAGEG